MTALNPRISFVLLALVIGAGLAARLAWVMRQPTDPATLAALPDQQEYFELGQHLHQHQGLWFSDPRFLQPVLAYRAPGYPMLIALCGGNLRTVRIVQAALDASVILAIFLLARRWLSHGLSLLAALIVAVDPYLIYFTGLILSETLYAAMLAWGMVLLLRSGGPWPRPWYRLAGWLFGGVLLAAAILVRPGMIAIPVLLGSAAALLNRNRALSYKSYWPLPVASTMLLLTILVLFPWAARNRWRLGGWIWTTTNVGITRYDGFNPDATGASDQSFALLMPWDRDMNELGRSIYFGRLASDWMRAHPWRSAWLGVIKIGRTLSPMPLASEFRSRRLQLAGALLFGLIFDVLIVLGLWRGSLAWSAKWFLLLPMLYVCAAAALSVGSLRYRIPAEAPMAVIAACAIGARGREHGSGES